AFDIRGVQLTGVRDALRVVLLEAPLGGVAERAVEPDTIDADGFLREANRQLLPFFPWQHGGVPAGAGKISFAEPSRQHDYYPERQTDVGFVVDRAVEKHLVHVARDRRRLRALAIQPVPDQPRAQNDNEDSDDDGDESAARHQNSFRYSINASFSSRLRSVPYSCPSCPPLSLPRAVVSYGQPNCLA